jgi:bifunctional ADP-heptose synthase (sugar kinase/adenylyltransferase)
MPEAERAEILSALGCVDYVLVFDDDTADALISRLRPAVHAKGTDYTEETVPERQSVLSQGGRVAIAGDAKSHSSRDLIQAIVRAFGKPR